MRRRAFLRNGGFAALGVAFGASPSSAQGLSGTCLILDFDGEPESYRLLRAGTPVPVQVLGELYGGDRLQVLSPAGKLVFRDGGRRLRTIRRADGVVEVRPGPSPKTRAGNVIKLLQEKLARQRALPRRPYGTRAPWDQSASLAWPFADLASGSATIEIGAKELAFAWLGGVPPFRIVLHGPSGEIVVDEADVETLQLGLKDARLIRHGPYQLIVSDAHGRAVSGAFNGIDAQQTTRGLQFTAADAIESAAALLVRDSSRTFQAYTTLAAYRRESQGADDFMEVLASGGA